MTDKEQIMIDGVDILKEKINMCFILLLNKLETPETIEQTIYEHLDTFVRYWNAQLARKTQECEELKRKVELMMDCPDCKVDEYEKALEEIEEVINNILNSCLGRNTVGCRPTHNVCGDLIKILNIIHKAKGEIMEIT